MYPMCSHASPVLQKRTCPSSTLPHKAPSPMRIPHVDVDPDDSLDLHMPYWGWQEGRNVTSSPQSVRHNSRKWQLVTVSGTANARGYKGISDSLLFLYHPLAAPLPSCIHIHSSGNPNLDTPSFQHEDLHYLLSPCGSCHCCSPRHSQLRRRRL